MDWRQFAVDLAIGKDRFKRLLKTYYGLVTGIHVLLRHDPALDIGLFIKDENPEAPF
ncbi:hypothetical protein HY3_00450 [Hyphomonas pacifica]|uniref:Uncharacterized protein n=1 Tax=Hyphomonas pacifica TaxID=1280941 RepID=A0A062TYC9_9PROT|nr:hypothetical protein HY2_00620 [Hyphomonas pacifica]RAN36080.1 hypothetical protein HY3_00450 [Hyphomonas pacifica]